MVADGNPREEVSRWAVEHIILPKPHHDFGNTARGIGSTSAIWQAMFARGIPHAHNPERTVAFRSKNHAHYWNLGELAPSGAKSNAEKTATAMTWWNSQKADVRNDWGRYFASPLS
jgi:hypothetical protein